MKLKEKMALEAHMSMGCVHPITCHAEQAFLAGFEAAREMIQKAAAVYGHLNLIDEGITDLNLMLTIRHLGEEEVEMA